MSSDTMRVVNVEAAGGAEGSASTGNRTDRRPSYAALWTRRATPGAHANRREDNEKVCAPKICSPSRWSEMRGGGGVRVAQDLADEEAFIGHYYGLLLDV